MTDPAEVARLESFGKVAWNRLRPVPGADWRKDGGGLQPQSLNEPTDGKAPLAVDTDGWLRGGEGGRDATDACSPVPADAALLRAGPSGDALALALGETLSHAVEAARRFITLAITEAPRIGGGVGPVATSISLTW